MKQPKAILFDCWNTLFVSTLHDELEDIAARIAQRPCDYRFIKTFEASYMTKPHPDLKPPTEDFLRALELPVTAELVDEIDGTLMHELDNQRIFPEALAVVKELRAHYRLGIVTNSWEIAFEHLIKSYQLENYFDVLMPSYEAGVIKPEAGIFRAALDRLELDAEEVVMVGDSFDDDVKAANAVGMTGVLLDRSNTRPEVSPRIMSLQELPAFLGQL